MRWIFPFLALCMAGCSPSASVEMNRFTGVATARSGYETIDWTYPSRFEAEAAVLKARNDTLYVVNIAVTRSDRNYPAIRSVWVPGREINYVKLDERRVFTDRQEVGYIALQKARFEHAARHGFDVLVVSPRTSHEGHIPPVVFRRALDLLSTRGS